MFSKLTFVALIAVVVAAPQQHHTASQYPAGVDPSKCPDFPICDNAILHNQQPSSVNPAPSWNQQQPSQSQWNQPQAQSQNQWNSQPRAEQQWNQPQPQQWSQPKQQQWNQPQPQQWNQQPQPQAHQPQPSWNSAPYQTPSNHLTGNQNSSEDDINGPGGDKYPAGVNPKSCPNYPYCDVPASYDSAPAAPAPAVKTGYSDRQSQYPAGVSPHSCPNFPYCS